MEDKSKKQENKKTTPVSWHHSRWFWGVVMGVVFILFFKLYIGIPAITFGFRGYNLIEKLFLFFWPHLPFGFLTSLSVILGSNIYHSIDKIMVGSTIYLFIAAYYLSFCLLIYKIFQNKKVRLRYPIILFFSLALSLFGIMISSIAS